MTFRLAHISDIHLGPLPDARFRDLVSKRITGYVNWHRKRARSMGLEPLIGLVNSLKTIAPDHIAVTGDLMNIGLPEEIDNTALWLEALGAPHDVTLVPGNHDAYVRGVLTRALARWAPYVTGDDGRAMTSNATFPFLRVRGPVAIIAVNSAVATTPFVAAGTVGPGQLERMTTMLEDTGRAGLFRVVLIHHPPIKGAARPQKRLLGIRRFQKAIETAGAELVLHGHTHLAQRHFIAGKNGTPVPVIGVPSASEGLASKRPASTLNLFEIARTPAGRWQLQLQQHRLTKLTAPHTPQSREYLLGHEGPVPRDETNQPN